MTGLVIDFQLLCKYCHVCSVRKIELGESSEDFGEWEKNHKENGECDVNYEGSAPAMEMNGAEILWKRSVAKNKMRYITVLSDGDSKTLNHLNQRVQPYGPGVVIVKEECMNHLSKRVGTALRNLVAEEEARGITLGGKKPGSLKDTTIIKLQSFYHKAVISNMPNVSATRTAIIASIDHLNSTDEKPKHKKCPTGRDSWCFYNKARALKVKAKSHSKMTITLNDEVYKKVKPVYERLSNVDLLSRCSRLATQNANESLHSVIWNKCRKETFLSKRKYELGVTRGIGEYNMGLSKMLEVKNHYHSADFQDEARAVNFDSCIAKSIDRKRKLQSSDQVVKTKKRALKKSQKKRTVSEAKKKEGITYQVGGF